MSVNVSFLNNQEGIRVRESLSIATRLPPTTGEWSESAAEPRPPGGADITKEVKYALFGQVVVALDTVETCQGIMALTRGRVLLELV